MVTVSAQDVAAYILRSAGPMSAMKLQKLVYYSQAWSLVWDESPLFKDRVEAWANGPVVPSLYSQHAGRFDLGKDETLGGDASKLSKVQQETVDAVLKFYGQLSAVQLSEITHLETPWMSARKGLAVGERGTQEITTAAMAEYYGSLT